MLIAGRLPGRTDNEVKNYWNTILLKKLQAQGRAASDSKVTIAQSQTEEKGHQDFSLRNLKLQQIPGQCSSPWIQIDDNKDQDDNSFISSIDFDTDKDYDDQFEIGGKSEGLKQLELKQIASLLHIEKELRELL